jgi:hypothetical protein
MLLRNDQLLDIKTSFSGSSSGSSGEEDDAYELDEARRL